VRATTARTPATITPGGVSGPHSERVIALKLTLT
jgi:hypothetical protein